MIKIKDRNMQNQHLVNGEAKAIDDPDGVKRQTKRRGHTMWSTIPGLFVIVAVILAVIVAITTR